jgi:hypothetical protein
MHFPAISPYSIDQLTIDWWCVYLAHTQKLIEREAQMRAALPNRR